MAANEFKITNDQILELTIASMYVTTCIDGLGRKTGTELYYKYADQTPRPLNHYEFINRILREYYWHRDERALFFPITDKNGTPGGDFTNVLVLSVFNALYALYYTYYIKDRSYDRSGERHRMQLMTLYNPHSTAIEHIDQRIHDVLSYVEKLFTIYTHRRDTSWKPVFRNALIHAQALKEQLN